MCRGLKFAFPQRVSPIEVKASFEKAYWSLEPHLENDNLKELAAATLRSVALNYIQRKVQKPSKTLLLAIEQLKRRDDIIITKPDKGSGVVVMDKSEYLRLLSEAFINNSGKIRAVPLERPSIKGRPPLDSIVPSFHPSFHRSIVPSFHRFHRSSNPVQIYCRYGPPYRLQISAFVWLTKNTQGTFGDAPYTISNHIYNYALAK